jgi:transposase
MAERYPRVRRTDPYTHRPLVEFVLSLPEAFFWKTGEVRPLTRRALIDVLPIDFLRIATKSSANAVKADRAARLAPRLVQEQGLMGPATRWELVRREYVAAAPLAAALRDLFEDGNLRPWLRRWIPLEAWLRTLPRLARTPSPTASEAPDALSIGGR